MLGLTSTPPPSGVLGGLGDLIGRLVEAHLPDAGPLPACLVPEVVLTTRRILVIRIGRCYIRNGICVLPSLGRLARQDVQRYCFLENLAARQACKHDGQREDNTECNCKFHSELFRTGSVLNKRPNVQPYGHGAAEHEKSAWNDPDMPWLIAFDNHSQLRAKEHNVDCYSHEPGISRCRPSEGTDALSQMVERQPHAAQRTYKQKGDSSSCHVDLVLIESCCRLCRIRHGFPFQKRVRRTQSCTLVCVQVGVHEYVRDTEMPSDEFGKCEWITRNQSTEELVKTKDNLVLGFCTG